MHGRVCECRCAEGQGDDGELCGVESGGGAVQGGAGEVGEGGGDECCGVSVFLSEEGRDANC